MQFNDLYSWDKAYIDEIIKCQAEKDMTVAKALKLDKKAVLRMANSNFLTMRSKTSGAINGAVLEVIELRTASDGDIKEIMLGIV